MSPVPAPRPQHPQVPMGHPPPSPCPQPPWVPTGPSTPPLPPDNKSLPGTRHVPWGDVGGVCPPPPGDRTHAGVNRERGGPFGDPHVLCGVPRAPCGCWGAEAGGAGTGVIPVCRCRYWERVPGPVPGSVLGYQYGTGSRYWGPVLVQGSEGQYWDHPSMLVPVLGSVPGCRCWYRWVGAVLG